MRLDVPLPERGGRAAELTCKSKLTRLPFQPALVADPGCLPDYCLGCLLVLLCRQNGNASLAQPQRDAAPY
jgi:hypothetical protein